ncbi:hypothetical protein L208DRAFT_604524 [Tricholoma matsutake]|nr:hypothetical protein L208DRAFT_604524 [Tricholoma matsutake 945]
MWVSVPIPIPTHTHKHGYGFYFYFYFYFYFLVEAFFPQCVGGFETLEFHFWKTILLNMGMTTLLLSPPA